MNLGGGEDQVDLQSTLTTLTTPGGAQFEDWELLFGECRVALTAKAWARTLSVLEETSCTPC